MRAGTRWERRNSSDKRYRFASRERYTPERQRGDMLHPSSVSYSTRFQVLFLLLIVRQRGRGARGHATASTGYPSRPSVKFCVRKYQSLEVLKKNVDTQEVPLAPCSPTVGGRESCCYKSSLPPQQKPSRALARERWDPVEPTTTIKK